VLTDDQARTALALLDAGSTRYAVAQRFGVSQKTIRALARGITYRHIARPDGLPKAA
jgi:hypothetical protein